MDKIIETAIKASEFAANKKKIIDIAMKIKMNAEKKSGIIEADIIDFFTMFVGVGRL